MAELILGLGGSDHEFSAALMRGDDILVAIEQERLSRRKHGIPLWYEDPVQKSIDYCLEASKVSSSEIQAIASSDILPLRVQHNLGRYPTRLFPHHLCHAASAYLMLPRNSKAGVIVYDGFGSIRGTAKDPTQPHRFARETFSFFLFGPRGYECLGHTVGHGLIEDDFHAIISNSAGLLYELVTSLLGNHHMDCGKTMGLSSHGVPRYLDDLELFITYGDEMTSCFNCQLDNPELVKRIEDILQAGRHGFTVKADLAASLQAIINKALLRCANFFRDFDIDFICVSGGCGLNTVANSFLVEHANLDVPVIIPPYCGDAGIAFGALWLERLRQTGSIPTFTFRGADPYPHLARPGKRYSREECRRAVQEFYPRVADDASITSAADVARLIAGGEIIGVFNGSSEIGPRALGGRSIFADPSRAMMREKINRTIKHREPYRPLAPMVLRSRYRDYFEDDRNADPFMLKIARARQRCAREAPAVVHVDGTARVQVVPDDGDPFLVGVLEAFYEQTGRGLIINTSFNRRGEPIVESPLDAVDAFLGMTLDGLYLDGEFYRSADRISPNN